MTFEMLDMESKEREDIEFMAFHQVKGKWVARDFKRGTQKIYLLNYYLKSEVFHDGSAEEEVVAECDLQKRMDELARNDEVICLTIWEKKSIDYKEDK